MRLSGDKNTLHIKRNYGNHIDWRIERISNVLKEVLLLYLVIFIVRVYSRTVYAILDENE